MYIRLIKVTITNKNNIFEKLDLINDENIIKIELIKVVAFIVWFIIEWFSW